MADHTKYKLFVARARRFMPPENPMTAPKVLRWHTVRELEEWEH